MAKRRLIYKIGSRINLKIPKYISKETLDWLNKQQNVTSAIFYELEKIARKEYIEVYKINEYIKNNLNNILLYTLIEKNIDGIDSRILEIIEQRFKNEDITNINKINEKENKSEIQIKTQSSGEGVLKEEIHQNQNIEIKENKEQISDKEIVKEVKVNITQSQINNNNTEESKNNILNKTSILSKYARNTNRLANRRKSLKALATKEENKNEIFVNLNS